MRGKFKPRKESLLLILVVAVAILMTFISIIIFESTYLRCTGTEKTIIAEKVLPTNTPIATSTSEPTVTPTIEPTIEPTLVPTKAPVAEKAFEPTSVDLSVKVQKYIFKVCDKEDISPYLVLAMIERESGCNPKAIGDSGRSYGLMQIQPRWHSERMSKLGIDDLLNPYDNVRVGVDILADYFHAHEDVGFVLMTYNGGYGYAKRKDSQGVLSEYAIEVLERAEELETEMEE